MTRGIDYAASPRAEFAHVLPDGVRSALDVGCAKGGFAATLRRLYGPDARLEGIEPEPDAAALARETEFDAVHTGGFPDAVPAGSRYDLITFWDVLEHFPDPWEVLGRCRDMLSERGVIATAIPNITYLPALREIVQHSRFPYTRDGGVFDITHLRFFTRSSIMDLFEASHYDVVSCEGVYDVLDLGRYRLLKPLARVVGDRRWLNFLVVARPRAASR